MRTSDERNPYLHKNGKPWLRRSAVAFLDILGFQDFMSESIRQRREHRSLLVLRSALDQSVQHLRPWRGNASGERDLFAIRTFTDNIVIGFPTEKFDSEFPLGLVALNVARFQLQMVLCGFFVRGALTIGNLYMDAEIVYGKGLLEAYQAEMQLARDPRIVLAKSAYTDLKAHIGSYSEPKESPQYSEWLHDADGQFFLNYLEIFYGEADYDVDATSEVLENHRSVIETKLEAYRRTPNLWNKYAWVARYHNYFCACHKGLFAGQKIDSRRLGLQPARIL